MIELKNRAHFVLALCHGFVSVWFYAFVDKFCSHFAVIAPL
jgi:hypothetical protein